jgi:colicin import membrane protein
VDVKAKAPTEAAQPEPLKSALERLRQEVGKAEAAKSSSTATSTDRATGKPGGKQGGKPGPFNVDGKKTAELIDLYRLEIAFQIQKNWAFNEQLAGGDHSLVAAIVFKVMPDGEIRDIFFTDRSGNTYLDESAYKAIVKSNPVDRHPNGLVHHPYVVMAIRFTPQGIR